MEGGETHQVILSNFAFKIFFCHGREGVNQRGIACEKGQWILLVESSLLTANFLVRIFREPDTVHVVLVFSEGLEEGSSCESYARVFLVVLDRSMQGRVFTIIIVVFKDGLLGFRWICEIQIRAFWSNKGSCSRKFIVNYGRVGELIEEVSKLVSYIELFDHFQLSERYPFEGCRFVEAHEVGIALTVKPLNLVEEHTEHGKWVQFWVDLLKMFADYNHSMFHSEEAIADN